MIAIYRFNMVVEKIAIFQGGFVAYRIRPISSAMFKLTIDGANVVNVARV